MVEASRTDTPTGAKGVLAPIHRIHRSRSTMLRLSVAGMLTTLVVGGVAALSSYRGTFATGAVCSLLAVLLLWGRVFPRMAARARFANEVT